MAVTSAGPPANGAAAPLPTLLAVQEPPSSSASSSSSRSRILVSLQTIRSFKLQTGDPIALFNPESNHFTVGTVWPSFALDQGSLQLPPLLAASSTIEPVDHVHLLPLHPPTAPAKPPLAASLTLSLQRFHPPAKLTSEQTQMLTIFAKEAIVELECVHLQQPLHLTFQGTRYTFVVASFHDQQQRPGMALALSGAVTTSVCLVSRHTHVALSVAKSPRDNESQHDVSASDVAAEQQEQRSSQAYSALGGLDGQIQEIRALVEMPLTKPEIFRQYGLRPPKGVLLYGPPGTGKTSLARAVAASTGSSYLTINGPELSSAFHGETEGKLREVFKEARRKSPCVVIIDEVDALAPRREGGSGGDGGNGDGAGEVERRVVAQLLTLLDGMEDGDGSDDEEGFEDEAGQTPLTKVPSSGVVGSAATSSSSRGPPRVVVLAATNRPNAIDPALRRPGRLDREIEIGIPTADARRSIVTALLRGVPHELTSQQIEDLASRTHGYVGADLSALVREAGMRAVRRAFERQNAGSAVPTSLEEELGSLTLDQSTAASAAPRLTQDTAQDLVTYADFHYALPLVRPSAMREIFLEPPKVFWSDIADSPASDGLDTSPLASKSVHAQIRELVEWPLKHRAAFDRLGVVPPRGVLLYGPPGCSKTLIARALATESGLNFIAVKGPELYSKYVGESERAVREVFRKARSAAPSIVFFDEIDALTMTRSATSASTGASDRVIATLLNEMDGIESLANVVIVAATNRPEIIDPALLRPGRLDRLLYVGPPSTSARRQIFSTRTAKMSVGVLDLDRLAEMTTGCSGAEVVSVCQEAGLIAMNEDVSAERVEQRHFEVAAAGVKRRISPAMISSYERWRDAVTV